MAGHSKWANIQHRKGRQDARRGKLFSKLIREITIAAKIGGAEETHNIRLRAALDAARSANVPKDTIERAVRRGGGEDFGDNLEEIRYEGYGPAGVAVMVDCMTDNRKRTVGEVRHAFTKCGGNLGTDGCVGYLFSKVGQIAIQEGASEDKVMEAALEAGAEDVITNTDGSIEVITAPDECMDIKDKLSQTGLAVESAEVTMRAATSQMLDDAGDAETMIRLLDMLEDLDDVQKVYSNAEIPDAVLEKIEA